MTKHYLKRSLAKEFLYTEVQQVISKIPFLTSSVNAFLLYIYEEDFFKRKLRLCFELRESVSFIELELIHHEIAAAVLNEIRNINHEFNSVLKNLTGSQEPRIGFYGLGEGPFKPAGSLAKSKISVKLNY
jgi:hypothetical protein